MAFSYVEIAAEIIWRLALLISWQRPPDIHKLTRHSYQSLKFGCMDEV